MSTVLSQDLRRSELVTPRLSSPEAVSAGEPPLEALDFIELYVGNARQASYFYRNAMGMRLVAYAGPETGSPDQTSFVLEQGSIRLVLTTPLRPDTEAAAHIHRHGDGVRGIAFRVADARSAWRVATARDARSVREPGELRDEHGAVKLASIATFGDTIHSFLERGHYRGVHLPGYWPVEHDPFAHSVGLRNVERVSVSVGWGQASRWAEFYTQVMGFRPQSPMADPSCACLSKQMTLQERPLHLEIQEPKIQQPEIQESVMEMAPRQERSGRKAPPASPDRPFGVEQYLEYYHGAGVHRIALTTNDIFFTAAALRQRGVEFLAPPSCKGTGGANSREGLAGTIEEPLSELVRFGITAAREPGGYKLSCCTRPVEDRPTLLFEIVQHKKLGVRPVRR